MAQILVENKNYFGGCLLISTQIVRADSLFYKSIIYLVSHNDDGALGFIVNHQLGNFNCSIIFDSFEVNKTGDLKPLLFGGPIELQKGFVLHSADYNQEILLNIDSKISLSSNAQILQDIAKGEGPEKSIFALGYSNWEARQLEGEIANNCWIVMPYNEDIIFSSDNKTKWAKAYDIIGINSNFYSPIIGNA